jgi:hypothetical protein
LKVTTLPPCVDPNLVPVIVTEVPVTPDVGERLLIVGEGKVVNNSPLLGTELALVVTVTGPVSITLPTVDGTLATIDVSLQLTIELGLTPRALNFSALFPAVAPKLVPVMLTETPEPPDVGEMPVMVAAGTTVSGSPLLSMLSTFTTTLPVVAPVGTGTTIEVSLQLVGAATVPLNVTVLFPWGDPKFLPVTVIDAPTAPDVGRSCEMPGPEVTVKGRPLLATPLRETMTSPLVAPGGTQNTSEVSLQNDPEVAATPLKVTVLKVLPVPKLLPLRVTGDPTCPEVGDKLAKLGVEPTANRATLLLTELTVTHTFPVVAPVGTGTTMLLSFQLVGVPVKFPNLTVLLP